MTANLQEACCEDYRALLDKWNISNFQNALNKLRHRYAYKLALSEKH